MAIKCIIKKGEYYDSVTLMRAAKILSEQDGVIDSAVIMATSENIKMLTAAGLFTTETVAATENDLILIVKASTTERCDDLLLLASAELKKKSKSPTNEFNPKSLDSALAVLPEANLALISIAGRYAPREVRHALERGLHVMLFSDNVSLENEIELKKFATSQGLFLMGPDCGTAIINGVPLAFANNVKRGPVGIVAASGTGLQEVTTLLSNMNIGISQAIGTGGRDVKKEVGGIMFLAAIQALLDDPATKIILLVSKPPHESVLKKIISLTEQSSKPVIATFLGAEENTLAKSQIKWTANLTEGAYQVAAQLQNKKLAHCLPTLIQHFNWADGERKKLNPSQKFIRGLYTGGTYVSETQVVFANQLQPLFSNVPWGTTQQLEDINKSQSHTIIDFGEDEFTVGRPHPMIDFSLRNKRIIEEAKNPETALLLLDLVLGWGAHPNPIPELLPTLIEAQVIAQNNQRHLPIIITVTGTESDPQCRSQVMTTLESAGIHVAPSNAAAAQIALRLVHGDKQ